MLRKRPWNRIDMQIYSLSTKDDLVCNMNICTYVSAVSLENKKYMISVYKNTKTLENLQRTKRGLLQFLAKQHSAVVSRFGKQSGLKKDKLKNFQNKLHFLNGYAYLSDCLAVIELHVDEFIDVGDHILALCTVQSFKNISKGEGLMLSDLRKKGLVRV